MISNNSMIPSAIEEEIAILGAIMLDKDSYDRISSFMQPYMFFKESHAHIYKAIQNLTEKKQPIEMISVCREITTMGKEAIVGGPYTIASLTNKIFSSANIETHARIVQQQYIARQIINTCHKYYSLSHDVTSDPLEILEQLQKELVALEPNEGGQVKKSGDIATEVLNNIKELREDPDKAIGILCGIKCIDDALLGFHTKRVYVIAARPAMGKSASGKTMITNMMLNGVPCAFLSIEVPAEDIMIQMISQITGINNDKLKNPKRLTPQEFEKVMEARKFITDNMILDDSHTTITMLAKKVKKWVKEKKLKVLLVDYLQKFPLTSKELKERPIREQQVSYISDSLLTIAKENDIAVIELAQLGREVEKIKPYRPMLHHLKESGSIEQDAHTVMFIYRPEVYLDLPRQDENFNSIEGKAEFIIAKNRGGKTGSVWCEWNGGLTKFSDISIPPPPDKQAHIPY